MRARSTAAVVTLSAVAAFGVYLGGHTLDGRLPLPRPTRVCTVSGGAAQASPAGRTVSLNPSQMANAATIAATGIRREMPGQAVVVALATAWQESRLENLSGGDRDSIGLFQQRPSQGWGRPEQIRDPRYAANQFYTALVRVRGWQNMRVTDAAQAVQRSAYPEAYEKWADEAALLASALLGNASGAVACTMAREPAVRGAAAATALTSGLKLDWGLLRIAAPAEVAGVVVPAADVQAGWRYAHWLVAHASGNGIKRVRFGDLQWTADEGTWGPAEGSPAATAHVVAEVFADV